MFPNLEAEMARKNQERGSTESAWRALCNYRRQNNREDSIYIERGFSNQKISVSRISYRVSFSKEVEAYGITSHSACN